MTNEIAEDKVKIHPALLWVGVPVLILGTLGIIIWQRKRKEKEEPEEATQYASNVSSPGQKPKPASFECKSTSYPLEFGTCHKDVTILQRYLKSLKADLGVSDIDGKFGNLTRIAAKAKTGKTSFGPKDIQGMKRSLSILKA